MNLSNQTIVERIKKLARNSKLFPNIEILGSYEEFSQTVMVNYLEKKELNEVINAFTKYQKINSSAFDLGENYNLIRKFFSTCTHELTHWLDHTSTLWGQKHLILVYNAINAWTNQDENELYRIIIYNSERNRVFLSSYYTEEYKALASFSNTEPWQYQFSCGLEFGIDGKPREDRPIIFTTFSNTQGERLIRIPFTVSSLTETNATNSEFMVKAQCFHMLSENDKIVEANILSKNTFENLYNPKLAIYSLASHCLANNLKITEIYTAYKLASALSTLCLNLPHKLFKYLKTSNELNLIAERAESLKKLYDPGFAYFNIVANAPKYDEGSKISEWLEEAVINSGLPKLDEINKIALLEMEELEGMIIDGRYADNLRHLLSIGRNNFMKRGIYGQEVLSLTNLVSTDIKLPLILLGDGTIVPINHNYSINEADDMYEWLNESVEIELRISEFLEACRY